MRATSLRNARRRSCLICISVQSVAANVKTLYANRVRVLPSSKEGSSKTPSLRRRFSDRKHDCDAGLMCHLFRGGKFQLRSTRPSDIAWRFVAPRGGPLTMFLEQLCGAPLLGGSEHRYAAGPRTSSMKCETSSFGSAFAVCS